MQITTITINNFRCFSQVTFNLSSKFVLISGDNGAGKTSLLEAIHYLCYLRSFRANSPKELVQFGKNHFFIKITCVNQGEENHIQVGYTGNDRLVKINAVAVSSYKELLDYYRVITLQEDDLNLIKGGPEVRRAFIDQHIVFFDHSFLEIIKRYKVVLNNRNSLLKDGFVKNNAESHKIWTEQLWTLSRIIQEKRVQALQQLQEKVNALIALYFNNEVIIDFVYQYTRMNSDDSFENFHLNFQQKLYADEYRYGRSLFGAHLDNFLISFKNQKSREFSSRGQQKLIVTLLKIAQIELLKIAKGASLFLLDDFMTDFDERRAKAFVPIFEQLSGQIVMTSPLNKSYWGDYLQSRGVEMILLPPPLP